MKKLIQENRASYKRLADRKAMKARQRKGNSRPDREEEATLKQLAQLAGKKAVSANGDLFFGAKALPNLIDLTTDLTRAIKNGERVILDLGKVNLLTAAPATFLYAVISSLKDKYGAACVTLRTKNLTPSVHTVLNITGLTDALNDSSHTDVSISMPIIGGQQDEHCDVIANYLTERAVADGWVEDTPEARATIGNRTYAAVSEAMLNVEHHAFPENKEQHQWWTTAAIIQDSLYLAICDLGVGIPSTLAGDSWWRKTKNAILNSDADMIEAAMQHTRSSVPEKGGRGKGTRAMQNLVVEQKKGHFVVASGKGFYLLNGETSKEIKNELKCSINGTIIQWRIPLQHAA